MLIMTAWSAVFLVALSCCFKEVSGDKDDTERDFVADFNHVPIPTASSLSKLQAGEISMTTDATEKFKKVIHAMVVKQSRK